MEDERDYFDLSDAEILALKNIENNLDSDYRIDLAWEVIRENEDLYKMWKREKDRIEFKVAKQRLKNHYRKYIGYLINTPYYELNWYEEIVMAPLVIGLKVINWILKKVNERLVK